MSIWSIVFVLLSAEVVFTLFLLIPLPLLVREPLIKNLSKGRHVFVIIALLMCIGAYHEYVDFTYKNNQEKIDAQTQQDMRNQIQFKAIRSQRNFYMSVLCAVLSTIIWRLSGFLLQYVTLVRKVSLLENQTAASIESKKTK